jgi:septation ring formation regulator EzrA
MAIVANSSVFIDAQGNSLDDVDAHLVVIESDISAMKANIRELTNTLDAFLKRLTAHEEEFELLKREMKFVKKILKEKLHVDLEREMPRSAV